MDMYLANKFGYFSALGLFLVGLVYIAVVAFGISQAGLDDPIVDPVLAVMEAITLLSAPLIVAVSASILETANKERKILAILGLVFAGIMAGLTSTVHFVALSAGRQTGFTVLEWPSTLYAVELLAWDVFLGLSLLFSAFVFTGTGVRAAARRALLAAGTLSLIGAVGPLVGDMALQRIGILGYGIGLPIASLMLVRYFRANTALHREPQEVL